jgi:hypothetical protein
MRRNLFILAAAAAALLSCREPSGREDFIAGKGPFIFSLDMTDTTRLYDFSFYTRLDGRPHVLAGIVDMPLDIQWVSPSGNIYEETVWLPLTDSSATFYSRQIRRPYRTDVVPVESGVWGLSVSVPDSVDIPGLRGLGLVQHHKKR